MPVVCQSTDLFILFFFTHLFILLTSCQLWRPPYICFGPFPPHLSPFICEYNLFKLSFQSNHLLRNYLCYMDNVDVKYCEWWRLVYTMSWLLQLTYYCFVKIIRCM